MLIRPNKKFDFSCGNCSCTTFVLTSYSLYTQIMLILILINVKYLQNVVFGFENGLNGQNHSLPDSQHPVKNPIGGYSTLSLNTIRITLYSSSQTPNIWHNKHNKECLCSLSYPLILNILIDRSVTCQEKHKLQLIN